MTLKSSLNIWLVQSGEQLPLHRDVRRLRTGMLAEELASRGHGVLWWTSAFEHQRKLMFASDGEEFELGSNLHAKTVRGLGYRKNISIRRYLDHRLVAHRFARQAREQSRPDIIVISMPCLHLGFEAARYATNAGIPYLIDVRDLWPDVIAHHAPGRIGKRLARRVLNNDFERLRIQLRGAVGILAVSQGYLRWALEHARRERREVDRVFFLGYGRRAGETAPIPAHVEQWLTAGSGRKLMVFSGTFGRSYELGLLLDVAERLRARGRGDIGFVFAGDGEQRASIERAARNNDNVLYCGWLNDAQLAGIVQCAHAGIVPCRSARDTMPNKVFEYLAAGLPLISSLEGEMAEWIASQNLGLSYAAGDADGLERAVCRFADDPALHSNASQRAREFFVDHADADRIYAEYANLVEAVAEPR